MKKADNFDASKWLVENKITTQSRLNENKIPGVNVEVDDDNVELSGDSGDYSGFIEDNGTVSFSVIYEDEDDRDGMEFDDQNWKDILGDDHVFVKVANAIPTKVEAMGDYVMITVKADDLTENKLNEAKQVTTYLDDTQKSSLVSVTQKVSDLLSAIDMAAKVNSHEDIINWLGLSKEQLLNIQRRLNQIDLK